MSKWDGNVRTSVLCTYCKNRVRVFLCIKYIVKLKFNSHSVGDRVTGNTLGDNTLIQGMFSAQSFREWEMEGVWHWLTVCTISMRVHWRKHTNLGLKVSEKVLILFLFLSKWYFVCLAAEPTVNKSYLSLIGSCAALAQHCAGQWRAFTIWVYKSIINQWEGRGQSDSAFLLLLHSDGWTNMLLHGHQLLVLCSSNSVCNI